VCVRVCVPVSDWAWLGSTGNAAWPPARPAPLFRCTWSAGRDHACGTDPRGAFPTLSLLAERATALQLRAVRLGVEVGGGKAALAARLVGTLHARQRAPLPSSVLSIDVGLRNLAFAHVASDGRVLDWQRVAVVADGHASHDAAASARAARALVTRLPSAPLVAIEQQRHRTRGSAAVAEAVFRLGVLEGQLHALLPGAVPVAPGRVARLFALPPGRDKKAAAVATVHALLHPPATAAAAPGPLPLPLPVTPVVPAALVAAYGHERKRDDLADCLLQALAVLAWHTHARTDAAALLPACAAPAPCPCQHDTCTA
jgi:hypothetical protein